MYYDVTNFIAIPYSEGVLLKWNAGQGLPTVTTKITPVTQGLYRYDGFPPFSPPLLQGPMTPDPALDDSNFIDEVGSDSGYSESYEAFGLDLGTPHEVSKFYLWDDGVIIGVPTSGTIVIFGSLDGSNWTQVGALLTYTAVSRIGNRYSVIIPTVTNVAYRYWAIYTPDTITVASQELRFTELEAYATTSGSTTSDLCKVTIQYSNDPLLYNIPNTPPYAVRDLGQHQLSPNFVYHKNLVDGLPYYYSLFIYYPDSKLWHGPYKSNPVFVTPTVNLGIPFASGSLSYSKLGINTRVSPLNDNVVEVLVWLPISLSDRQPAVTAALNEIKPAHVVLKVGYEHFYVAHTTTQQFSGSLYAKNVYSIVNGTVTNMRPTIDSSFDGVMGIL